jgi:H+-translocating NAD(P) transhydrogenase subunit alpha
MKIAVAAESDAGEPQAAPTPDTIRKEDGRPWRRCRRRTGRRDEVGIYAAAGATVTADAVNGAEIVLQVRQPQSAEPLA